MSDCPPVKDLAHLVETGEGDAELVAHIKTCDACQELQEHLQDEVLSLQISISSLWFREQISCIEPENLRKHVEGQLAADHAAYVAFHLDELKCATCQALIEQIRNESTDQGRRELSRARTRILDSTTSFLGDFKRGAKPKA